MDGAGNLRVAAITPSAAVVDHARAGVERADKHLSARRVFYITQIMGGLACIAGLVWSFWTAPSLSFAVLHWLCLGVFAITIIWRLAAASSLKPLPNRLHDGPVWPIYSVLCPLRGEANVIADLLLALEKLDYPTSALDVLLLIEDDDLPTIEAAFALKAQPYVRVVLVPAGEPRTKPKALNVGLALARGDYVVVYDAEDRPHPLQLRAAVAAFADGDEKLACVQAPLGIDNARQSWIATQFAAEYATQFWQVLPLLARLGLPLPLGGTSNHFRIETLRALHGWDPYNVTEDADLGYRLARAGKRCGIIAPPTWEEAPISFNAWRKQRTRWIKGHMQTWLVLMRQPLRAMRDMGVGAFFCMHLVLGGGILAALVHLPLALTLFIAAASPLDLLAPADFILALCGYCVAAFASLNASALTGNFTPLKAAPTMPLYWPLASISAYDAVKELLLRPHHWAKTAHGVSPRPRQARETPVVAIAQPQRLTG